MESLVAIDPTTVNFLRCDLVLITYTVMLFKERYNPVTCTSPRTACHYSAHVVTAGYVVPVLSSRTMYV
jgi:hypothetical protein